MAVLGLRGCPQAFPSCEQGLLSAAVRGLLTAGSSCCRAQSPGDQAQPWWPPGLVTPEHVDSSQTRDRTCVPCIGRQILSHWTARKAPNTCFNDIVTVTWQMDWEGAGGNVSSD